MVKLLYCWIIQPMDKEFGVLDIRKLPIYTSISFINKQQSFLSF